MANPLSVFSATTAPAPPAADRLRAQAEELEGVFLNTLTKEMFAGVNARGTFGGGFAEETWRGMQSEQFAASIAQAGGIGLADQIVRSLFDIQQSRTQGDPA
jgi:flagellar protein FlgJ